jgi:diguanylate cyclase (GGDEF)-like protein
MVAGLDAEADDFLKKPFDVIELRARLRSGERVLALQERLLSAQEALRHEATHDRLTGLWNRAMIVDQLDRELGRAEREGTPLAVVMGDIDNFKAINDSCGHAGGDLVLQQTATRMAGVPRLYDFIGRYGGEEFLLLLPGCDLVTARLVAERVRRAVGGEPVTVGPISVPLSVSLGVACTSPPHETSAALLQRVDEAMYRAKALGRNRVER